MRETWCGLVLGIILASVAADSPPWRSPPPWMHPPGGMAVVPPPQLSPPPYFSRRGGPLPGYLHLKPVSQSRSSRWFDSEPAYKPPYMSSRAGYERYPPFWSDNSKKSSKSIKPQSHRHAKKECNLCNSVPWTPIFKSPAGLSSNHHPRELVPHVEVYPDASIQQHTFVAPQSLISQHVPVPTVEASLGLPVGNIPVSPSLLLPVNQQIPFPELSPHPVAPVHENVRFHDSIGLVPPAPPKESANVVVTISEPETVSNVHISPQDQNYDSSSFVDNRLPHNNNYQHGNTHSQVNYNAPNSGLDIVKSVPLAEYTSSIDHPAQVIQSTQYIDINTQQQVQPNTAEFTYEKTSQTGSQKISDLILGGLKNTESKQHGILVDSDPAGSDKVTEQSQDTPPSGPAKAPKLEDSYNGESDPGRGLLDPNILTPPAPPLPPHLTQLLPTFETAFLHPLFPVDNKGVASVVNGALLPPPVPQPMNPVSVQPVDPSVPPKKIQIIIPYTTTKSGQDQNAVGNGVYQQAVNNLQKESLWPPIVVPDAFYNQPRRVPFSLNQTWPAQPEVNNQLQHILAANIRDLLKKEAEPKQNIRLQKNIDNWTAQEYSNHKVVGKKHPSDVISHAQAVTSMPGTSISHLLLPSKKIPDGYFPTSISPNYDEPATTPFPASSVSVNSEPFATASRYSSVAWSGPSTRPSRFQTTTPLPDDDNNIAQESTSVPRWSNYKVSVSPGSNEKVYVVTPVSQSTRRSTRHIDTTEKYSTTPLKNDIFTKLEKINRDTPPEDVAEKSKTKQKPIYPKSTALFKIKADAAKYEKISKFPKPKPIEKFFATTAQPAATYKLASSLSTEGSSASSETQSDTQAQSTTPMQFPFRNGGEIPVEMSQNNFSASELTFKNTGSRKTLIKQVKTNNRRPKDGIPEPIIVTPSGPNTEEMSRGTTTPRPPATMQVDVLMPNKTPSKKGEGKKATSYLKKKPIVVEIIEKSSNKTALKNDEPNITEDDRDDINDLMKELAIRAESTNETLLAVETGTPASMPAGVFGETRPENSSRSLLDTIKLLREFLAETSEEEISQEKSEQIGEVIKKLNTTSTTDKFQDSKYKFNFPEYLTSELQLNNEEMSLVKNAMVELKKSKGKKKDDKVS